MQSLEGIPEALRKHGQPEMASCAASGFESIAKLHGLIPADSFPLQSNPANQWLGFGDTTFLKSLGLLASNAELEVLEAVNLIEKETNEGRFPLAVQVTAKLDDKFACHTYVCVRHAGNLLLIDPSVPAIQAKGRKGIEDEFRSKIQQFPVRKTIHVLWYRKAD